MRIYVPYSGPEMPSIQMSDIGRRMNISVDIEHLGRKRIRRYAPTIPYIVPHQEYNVRLFPLSEDYRALSGWDSRRVNAVCWHGHRVFMVRLFDFYPDATLRSAIAQYNGIRDFTENHAETVNRLFNIRQTCKCGSYS